MPAESLRIPAEAYHARDEISRSNLEDFIRSPLLYHGLHVASPPRWETKATAAMELGTAVHAALEAYLRGVPDDIVTIPREALTSNGQRRGKAWDAFKAEHAGKVLVMPAEARQIADMMAGIDANEEARRALYNVGEVEETIVWLDEQHELRRRCRLDKRLTGEPWVIDIKTVHTLEEWPLRYHFADHGYHRQAAFYCDAAEALTDVKHNFRFVCLEKSPPYRAEVIELPDHWVERGRQEIADALERLSVCLISGNWTEPARVRVLEPPK